MLGTYFRVWVSEILNRSSLQDPEAIRLHDATRGFVSGVIGTCEFISLTGRYANYSGIARNSGVLEPNE